MQAKFINETYKSGVELKLLSDDINNIFQQYIKKNNINIRDYLIDLSQKDYDYDTTDLIGFKNIFNKIDKSKYTELKDFLNNHIIDIYIYGEISIYQPEEKNLIWGITENIFNKGVLRHELTHAYDDYRSNNNTSGGTIKYNYLSPQDRHKVWARLPSEISAQLTELLYPGPGYMGRESVDYNNIFRDDNNKIVTFDKVIDRFNNWMNATYVYNIWTTKIKRSIIRRLSQYWHKEQEQEQEQEYKNNKQ